MGRSSGGASPNGGSGIAVCPGRGISSLKLALSWFFGKSLRSPPPSTTRFMFGVTLSVRSTSRIRGAGLGMGYLMVVVALVTPV